MQAKNIGVLVAAHSKSMAAAWATYKTQQQNF
jgi:hypothetical protein